MNDILQEIVAAKQAALIERKKERSLLQLVDAYHELAVLNGTQKESGAGAKAALSMKAALVSSPSGIIAEFKRRSPAKGWINKGADAVTVTTGYQVNGASALSILTDTPYFGGTADDLLAVRPQIDIPILRKDFIIDEYQVYESFLLGANAILLIAAVLPRQTCDWFTALAHELGLEVLLEVHSEPELEHVTPQTDMVGVNNRNLGTFVTGVENSFRLSELLPREIVRVSESGLSDPAVVAQLRQAGYRGFLIGENFMRTPDPGAALGKFITGIANTPFAE